MECILFFVFVKPTVTMSTLTRTIEVISMLHLSVQFHDAIRPFPIDMAGFAINVQKITDQPKVRVGFEENGKPTQRGYLETSFLEKFATRETVECHGSTNEVLMWYFKLGEPVN